MNTFEGLEIHEIPQGVPTLRAKWAALLHANGLREEDVDYTLGLFDTDDNLLGTASLRDNVIKEVALSESVRNGSNTNALISAIMAHACECGHGNVMIFTKPEYRDTFRSMSFRYVGGTTEAILMESDPRGIESYRRYLESLRKEGRNGVIVMNANPMTTGHLALIRAAAAETDTLYVIPVDDNRSTEFPYRERAAILREATAGIPNVTVCEGSPYAISASTFPSYFLKKVSDATDTHIRLDLDIFTQHIAPALGATVRFAGTEPTDALTRRYNELMAELLPAKGIELRVIERTESDGTPVSASSIRRLMRERGGLERVAATAVPESLPYITAHIAARAMLAELELTPKPGLVDRHDSGAHTDMDFRLMEESINTLRPFLARIAREAYRGEGTDIIRRSGIEAERAMLSATGGVNTHKGAIFCMGLALAATSRLLAAGITPEAANLREAIMREAQAFTQPEGTHGDMTEKRYRRPGALDNAREGYPRLFDSWLPFYRSLDTDDNTRRLLTLLLIMSELDDSNILFRCGDKTADEIKQRAARLSETRDSTLLVNELRQLNEEFIGRNISPGGAADMLALTILTDKIIKTQ